MELAAVELAAVELAAVELAAVELAAVEATAAVGRRWGDSLVSPRSPCARGIF